MNSDQEWGIVSTLAQNQGRVFHMYSISFKRLKNIISEHNWPEMRVGRVYETNPRNQMTSTKMKKYLRCTICQERQNFNIIDIPEKYLVDCKLQKARYRSVKYQGEGSFEHIGAVVLLKHCNGQSGLDERQLSNRRWEYQYGVDVNEIGKDDLILSHRVINHISQKTITEN